MPRTSLRIVFQPPLRGVGRWCGADELAELAVAAEDAGLDAFAVTDHPFPPDAWLAAGGHHAYDPFAALAFVAAKTTRIRLLTNVVIAAYRSPFLTAKAAATVDVFSGGRLVLGVGAGYLEAEFAALGAAFAGRGPRFDNALTDIRASWSGATVYANGVAHTALPRPIQQPGPPIWIGGNSQRARLRAAQHGDGWMPFRQASKQALVTGTDPLRTLDELKRHVADLRQLAADRDRTEPLDVCFAPGRIDDLPDFLEKTGPACVDAGVTG